MMSPPLIRVTLNNWVQKRGEGNLWEGVGKSCFGPRTRIMKNESYIYDGGTCHCGTEVGIVGKVIIERRVGKCMRCVREWQCG